MITLFYLFFMKVNLIELTNMLLKLKY